MATQEYNGAGSKRGCPFATAEDTNALGSTKRLRGAIKKDRTQLKRIVDKAASTSRSDDNTLIVQAASPSASVSIGTSIPSQPELLYNLGDFKTTMDLSHVASIILWCMHEQGVNPSHITFRNRHEIQRLVIVTVPSFGHAYLAAASGTRGVDNTRPLLLRTEPPIRAGISEDGGSSSSVIVNGIPNSEKESTDARIASANLTAAAASSSSSSSRLPSQLRCVNGNASALPIVDVPRESPLHSLASIFPCVLPLSGSTSRWNLCHPGYDITRVSKKIAQTVSKPTKNSEAEVHPAAQKPFPISRMLLSKQQMLEHKYPLHPVQRGEAFAATTDEIHLSCFDEDVPTSKDEKWVHSNIRSLSPPNDKNRKLLSIDCEMCRTAKGLELTRFSVVNEKRETVIDEFILPYNEIIDYNTRYSGIVEETLANVTNRIEYAQQLLYGLVDQHTILLGQSLENDLGVLRFTHPFVIDTAVAYSSQRRGRVLKPSLRALTERFLGRVIQKVPIVLQPSSSSALLVAPEKQDASTGQQHPKSTGAPKIGHCSIEDALACMDLVLLRYKTLQDGAGSTPTLLDCLRTAQKPRKSLWVDTQSSCDTYGLTADEVVVIEKDDDVVKAVVERMQSPDGGPEFVWCHLHALNAYIHSYTGLVDPATGIPAPVDAGVIAARNNEILAQTCRRVREIYDSLPAMTMMVFLAPWNEKFAELLEMKWEKCARSSIEEELYQRSLLEAAERARRGCVMFAIKS